MNFNEYQKAASKTAIYPKHRTEQYLMAGLVSEVGEYAAQCARLIRDGNLVSKNDVTKELGDILWFLSEIASFEGINLETVAITNIQKLRYRQKMGTL